MVYGVYSNSDLVHWSPAKIFQDEIKVRQLTRSSYNGVKVNYSHTNRSSVRSHKPTAFLGPLPISTVARSESKEWWVVALSPLLFSFSKTSPPGHGRFLDS